MKQNNLIIGSKPHFYDADPVLLSGVKGLKPDKKKHDIEADFELVILLSMIFILIMLSFCNFNSVCRCSSKSSTTTTIEYGHGGCRRVSSNERPTQINSASFLGRRRSKFAHRIRILVQSITYVSLIVIGIFNINPDTIIFICYSKRKTLNNFYKMDKFSCWLDWYTC